MRHLTIWYPAPLRLRYVYGFCPSERAWRETGKFLPGQDSEYPPLTVSGCTSIFRNRRTKEPTALVTIADFNAQSTVELLTHEAVHVWQDMTAHMGAERPSSEFEAYGIQNILSDLIDAYRKTRNTRFLR